MIINNMAIQVVESSNGGYKIAILNTVNSFGY